MDHVASWRTRCALIVASALVCAACVWALTATTATAKTTAPKGHGALPLAAGSGYLALGDSVTFGYEESTVVPAPDYHNASSFLGYPEMLGTELHLRVANAACPGETSSSLIHASAQSNGCENVPAGSGVSYRKDFPLHVRYSGSQLAYAVKYLKAHPGVRLVSLMIGANDLFVCQETTADGCASSAEQQQVLHVIAKNVRTILSTIRTKAGYTGQLAIVNYYSLDYASPIANAESNELNRTDDAAAKPFHVVIANAYRTFARASVHSANNSCTAGLLTQLGAPGTCGVHPSYAGQALLAQTVEGAITTG
jgi:lysophospholipase L1-like esterase